MSPETSPLDPDIDTDRMPRLSVLRQKNFNLQLIDVVMFLLKPDYYDVLDRDEDAGPSQFSKMGNPLPRALAKSIFVFP